MRPNKIERRKELECAISFKEKEAADLQKRKAALEDELGMSNKGSTAGDLVTTFPVLDYCGNRPRKDIRSLSIEHVGGVLAQLDIAEKTIKQQNHNMEQQIRDLNRQIKAEGARRNQVKANTTSLEDATGFKAGGVDQSNGRRLITNNGAGDEAHVTVRELETKKLIIEKEVKAGELIMKKKEQAIVDLSKTVSERKAILDEIDSLHNDIRVVDRDAKCEKEVLQELIAEHDAVDAKLNSAMEIKTSASRLMIEENITGIKDEITETVTGVRRGQERVIKAQDYRIEQLGCRLDAIQKALNNNHLTREVEELLSGSWTSKGALLALGDEEDMYDLEAIIPAQEKCHPAIYNLFLTEKERLARRISLLNIIAKEKEEIIDALVCKVEALSKECQRAIQELDQVASGAAYEEEQQRLKAMEYIEEQRLYYSDLLFERQKLKSQNTRTPKRLTSK